MISATVLAKACSNHYGLRAQLQAQAISCWLEFTCSLCMPTEPSSLPQAPLKKSTHDVPHKTGLLIKLIIISFQKDLKTYTKVIGTPLENENPWTLFVSIGQIFTFWICQAWFSWKPYQNKCNRTNISYNWLLHSAWEAQYLNFWGGKPMNGLSMINKLNTLFTFN